jgi:hypothetical protein
MNNIGNSEKLALLPPFIHHHAQDRQEGGPSAGGEEEIWYLSEFLIVYNAKGTKKYLLCFCVKHQVENLELNKKSRPS